MNTIILFFSVKNGKNIIPVIKGSVVVYHYRNVSTVRVDHWLERERQLLSSHSNK